MKTVFAFVLLATLEVLGQSHIQQKSIEYPDTRVREEQEIVIDGAQEIWRLEWAGAPKRYCGASEAEDSLTCPCIGFAYGEMGDLYLHRMRDGVEIDRLRLTPLFAEYSGAVVQRWAADDDQDFKLSARHDFETMVNKRPTVQVMNFADYDHDGKSTEFYLQTDSEPCGKSVGVVIGLSISTPRLHVFGTASNPRKPLYMQKREWEALRNASTAPVKVLDWPCYDHGAETETELELEWSSEGIDGVRREYSCPTNSANPVLLSETPLAHVAP